MPGYRCFRLATIFAAALLLSASLARCARAIEPLPAEIPQVEVAAEESVSKAAEAIGRIEDPEERLPILSRAFYDLRGLGREKLLPLLSVAQRESEHDSRTVGSLSGPLAIVDPELLLKLTEQASDERMRDVCLYYYVSGGARLDAGKARRVVDRINDPKLRTRALVNIISNGKLRLPELKQVWAEIHAVGWPEGSGAPPYAIGYALVRLPPEEFPEVVAFVRRELEPDDAVLALCHMAGHYSYDQKRPDLAKDALAAAVELIPACKDRGAAANWILHYGYARLDRERAAELFHEHVVPVFRRKPGQQGGLGNLALGGIDFGLGHARKVAKEFGVPGETYEPTVLEAAANRLEPEVLLAWLKEQPASPTREMAISRLARGLFERSYKTVVEPSVHQKWVDLLSAEAVNISDPNLRREACESVYWLTRHPKSKATIAVPQALKDEYGRLWAKRAELAKGNALAWNMSFYFGLHSYEIQNGEIRRLYEAQRTRAAAARVRDSSLEAKTRRDWYDKLLAQARAISDNGQQAAALSGIATCLEQEWPSDAIAVLWEALHLVKPYRKSEAWNHDVGDELGDGLPPSNPDEALSSMYLNFRGGGEPAAEALWEFARKIDDPEEREPLLEALGKVLAQQKKFAHAAGLTSHLSNPARQVRLWVEIAAEQHNIPYAERQ